MICKKPRVLNVTQEMMKTTDGLARDTLTLAQSKVWEQTKAKMDEKYPDGWTGIQKEAVVRRVRKARAGLNNGDAFQALLSSKLIYMTDSNRKFLQFNACYPEINAKGSTSLNRLMIFGHPLLIELLKDGRVDLFIDATFDCCPHPFYQCLIIMAFDKRTDVYVPVLYILMSNKSEALYYQALCQVAILSDHKLDVHSYTTDFERAIINSCELYFPEGFHNGCLFHLKQAWRRYLITKLAFLAQDINLAMKVGVLDLLCIIPQKKLVRSVFYLFDQSSSRRIRRLHVSQSGILFRCILNHSGCQL